MENISLTVTYGGQDYKVKTKDLKLDGLTEVKVSVYELDGKVVTSTESAPDDAEKSLSSRLIWRSGRSLPCPRPMVWRWR